MSAIPPILEFDPDLAAIVNPQSHIKNADIPRKVVLCFFQDVLAQFLNKGVLEVCGNLASEIGANPVYRTEWQGQNLAVVHPGVGAPLAAGFLEELIALGGRSFIACGGCGVLDETIDVGYPIILTSAVRDEGTSYHYLPPAREVAASQKAVDSLEKTLQSKGIDYRLGKTWTTDGLYRETPSRRQNRMAEGCIVVEMEAAAFFAVARFRDVLFGQIVYGGDLVIPERWDNRGWISNTTSREALFWFAVEACVNLD
jgi:uridine phosphorylase